MRIRALFTNSAGILTSRVLGFLRDLLMASILGANIYSDIFFVAFKIPNLFRRLFAEGAFVQSFMPSLIASRNKATLSVMVLTRLFAFLILLSLLVVLFSEGVTRAIAFGFQESAIQAAAPLVALNFFYLDLIFLVTFLATLLQYREHFATTAFSTALLNIAMIGALLLTRREPPETIVWALSFSVLVGGFLQLAAHLVAAERLGLCPLLIGGFKHMKGRAQKTAQDLKRFQKAFGPALLGNSTAQVSAFIDTWLASFLISGSISYLFYANRIFQLPLALFAIAASTALFPSLSKHLKNEAFDEAKKDLFRAFWIVVFLLGAATIGGMLLAKPIIWLLFERGAFDAHDTAQTSRVLVMYMIGLLPYGLAKLFSLWLYGTHRQTEAAKIAALSLGMNILFSLSLIGPMKVAGLALAGSLGGWILLILTVRSVGWSTVFGMIRHKNALLFVAAMTLLALLLLGLQRIILAAI